MASHLTVVGVVDDDGDCQPLPKTAQVFPARLDAPAVVVDSTTRGWPILVPAYFDAQAGRWERVPSYRWVAATTRPAATPAPARVVLAPTPPRHRDRDLVWIWPPRRHHRRHLRQEPAAGQYLHLDHHLVIARPRHLAAHWRSDRTADSRNATYRRIRARRPLNPQPRLCGLGATSTEWSSRGR